MSDPLPQWQRSGRLTAPDGCSVALAKAHKPSPLTCRICGLGPCKFYTQQGSIPHSTLIDSDGMSSIPMPEGAKPPRPETPTPDYTNTLSMAACIMAKVDHMTWAEANAKLSVDANTLLRQKWLPVASAALEHFNFIPRPKLTGEQIHQALSDDSTKLAMQFAKESMYDEACKVAHAGRQHGLKSKRIIDDILTALHGISRV